MNFVVTSLPATAQSIGATLSTHNNLRDAVEEWLRAAIAGHVDYKYAVAELDSNGSLKELSSGDISVVLRTMGLKLER